MKRICNLAAAALMTALCAANTASALPLVWRADWPDAKPVETLVHRGTDIELQPLWRINKEPADTNGWTFTTFCQTNAVGPWFGPLPGAFFSHTNDVGAAFYNVMVRAQTPGGAVNYTAFARLRMLDSPGFTPGELPLPAKVLDFAQITVLNPPWGDVSADLTPATNYTDEVAAALSAAKQDKLPYPTNAIPQSVISGLSTALDGKLDNGGGTLYGSLYFSGIDYNQWDFINLSNTGEYPGGMAIGYDTYDRSFLFHSLDASYNWTTVRLPADKEGTVALSSDIDAATMTNALQDTAIEELSKDNAQTRQIVTTWENFLDGSNVVFSITNYMSGTYNLNAAKMTIKELRDGSYREVYNSRDEILLHMRDFKDNDFKNATNQVIGAVNAAIGNKADKDWGKYTSAGGVAPENTVYMTAPNTVFAGGLEYERVAVGEGAICVLTTRGAPVWTQGDEGTFKFQDGGGTNYFGFAKTDSYTIGANTDGITVRDGMVTLNYNITMSGRPCVWYKAELTSDTPWEQLNLSDGSQVSGASHVVIWEQNPPANSQVCYINVGNQPQGFFRATIEVAGEAKFMTNMPADLSGGIICPNTATGVNGVIKPTFNGTTVQWTWSAQ